MLKTNSKLRNLRLNSVFVKATAILAVCTTIVVAVPAVMNARQAESVALDHLTARAGALVDLLGHETGDAIESGDAERIAKITETAMDNGAPDVVAATAVSPDGTVLSHHSVPGTDMSGMRELGHKAILSAESARKAAGERAGHQEELILSEDGLTSAHPVYFGHDNRIVAAVVTRWSPAAVSARLKEDQAKTFLAQALVFTLAIIAASLALRWMVSTPLNRVNGAMQSVAAAKYDLDVPATQRGDEIGTIARSLDGFRQSLADNAAAQEETALKGAAFSGTSAALMLLNREFRILYVNPALEALMTQYRETFAVARPGFDPKALVGKSLEEVNGALQRETRLLGTASNLPLASELALEGERFHFAANAVFDTAGTQIGYVAEWKNVTQVQRNAGVLAALDVNQLRAEFTPDGRLDAANAKFCTLLGQSETALRSQDLRPSLTIDGKPAFSRLSEGEPVSGRFALTRGEIDLVLEGGFSPVSDATGKVRAWVFLASDVTDQYRTIAKAEAQRLALEAAQRQVVEALKVALGQLSDGDLTVAIPTAFSADYEELRTDFNQATVRLLDAMRAVVENAAQIEGEAQSISAASRDLSRRTEQQAATLEETAAALDQLTASVKSAADGAAQANRMVAEAKANAETSGEVVREAVVAMGEIAESSGKISRITSVIDEIAFQTNLLALNAGVEAARAGEAGRGFAVVASEVRALAQRSSDAAREIAELIAASSSQVKRGVDLVGQAGRALGGIATSVADIHSTVSEIAVSAGEQSAGLAEINLAVNQLDQVTQQNAAMFEQATATSAALTREAEALTRTMLRFRTGTAPAQRAAITPIAFAPNASARNASAPTASARNARPRFATGPGAGGTKADATGSGRAAAAARSAPEADEWEAF